MFLRFQIKFCSLSVGMPDISGLDSIAASTVMQLTSLHNVLSLEMKFCRQVARIGNKSLKVSVPQKLPHFLRFKNSDFLSQLGLKGHFA